MAIKTTTFGGVTLTGGAAKAFKKQFLDKPLPHNKKAQSALDKGREILKQLKSTGYARITTNK